MATVQFSDVALLAVNSSHGIYAYRSFAERYFTDEQKAKYPSLLLDPNEAEDSEWIEDWQLVEANERFLIDGVEYVIYQMDDIWLVPADAEIDWDEVY